MENLKTIEIRGYLSDNDWHKGKSALWFNEKVEIVPKNYNASDYAFSDEQINAELEKAQKYLNNLVWVRGWLICAIAFIRVF